MGTRSGYESFVGGAGLNTAEVRGSLLTMDSTGQAVVSTVPTNPIVGALDELSRQATAGGEVGVITHGKVSLIASAAIAAGDSVTAAPNGRAAKKAGAQTANDTIIALSDADAAGDRFDALLR